MTPEQLAELTARIDAAARHQDRMAAVVPEGLPGNTYSNGRAAGLRIAARLILDITGAPS